MSNSSFPYNITNASTEDILTNTIFNISDSSSNSSLDDFLIGLTLIEFIIMVVGSLLGLVCCIYICCIFGKKKPPLEYEHIVGKID